MESTSQTAIPSPLSQYHRRPQPLRRPKEALHTKSGYLTVERKVWRVDEKLAGYVQKWKNAGHLVPTDQSLNSQVMIEDWVLEKGLFAAQESEKILQVNTFKDCTTNGK